MFGTALGICSFETTRSAVAASVVHEERKTTMNERQAACFTTAAYR